MGTILSGATFGAAMIAAGFYNPAVVISQLKFENWHMVQAFLAATASSVYVQPLGQSSRLTGDRLANTLSKCLLHDS